MGATTNHLTADAEPRSWTEQTWDGRDHSGVTGPKRTTGAMTATYRGALEGEGETRFLMAYPDDASCTMLGHELLTATLDGRRGTLVLEHVGGYRDGVATSTFTVVHAEGELAGLTGTGRITWPHGSAGRFELDYEIN
ncbi:DUF3224 domain-containing protein [Saccharothrix yanglingensis]|uniref:DUF3224 domain-containing protein n=1 Tax=Saccharothrix yanglingensis TaxID=659496 RepID=UPI0027D2DB5F|nr:DUF3224 domain-containing protein [Saccharothrix yanglingensis]